jgi:hypothetical protein
MLYPLKYLYCLLSDCILPIESFFSPGLVVDDSQMGNVYALWKGRTSVRIAAPLMQEWNMFVEAVVGEPGLVLERFDGENSPFLLCWGGDHILILQAESGEDTLFLQAEVGGKGMLQQVELQQSVNPDPSSSTQQQDLPDFYWSLYLETGSTQ